MKTHHRSYLCSSVVVLVLAVCAALPIRSHAQTANTFALIGDLGYRPPEEPLLQNVLDDINKTSMAFVVHIGDLSSAPFACTNELLEKRLTQFNASAHPLVFTPGDRSEEHTSEL